MLPRTLKRLLFPRGAKGAASRVAKAALQASGVYSRAKANALKVRLRRVDLRIPRLPASLQGYRILHVTDTHLEDDPELVDATLECLEGVEAELGALTGDYVSRAFHHESPALRGLERILGAMRCSHGCFAVSGNHDCGDVMHHLADLGVTVLEDGVAHVARSSPATRVVGLRYTRSGRKPHFREVLDGLPRVPFTVLLVHKPDYRKQARRWGVNLYLCGHTHGGQVRVPLVGPLNMDRRAHRPYGDGAWRSGDLVGYTSRGVGTSFLDVRFGCGPEVALLTLRREQ